MFKIRIFTWQEGRYKQLHPQNEHVNYLDQLLNKQLHVLIPISRHVRMIRKAISPLLAINIFLNIVFSVSFEV